MSTEQLQRELARIAEKATVADVPTDTWQRARRSLVRTRVVAVAAAAAVVAVVAAGVTWLPHRLEPPVAKTDAGAIPSRIWTLPGDVSPAPEQDLALGPVSAAYVSEDDDTGRQRVVAITAKDGIYHVLWLPRRAESRTNGLGAWQTFALSPDGRRLAYAYRDKGNQVNAHTNGIAVVDLTTGDVRRVALSDPQRKEWVLVEGVQWSPGGTFLLWWGQDTSHGFGDTIAGVIAPDRTARLLPPEDQDGLAPSYAVGDDGTVLILETDRTRTWRDGQVVATEPADETTAPGWAQLVDGVLSEVRVPYETDAGVTSDAGVFVRHPGASAHVPGWVLRASAVGWTGDGTLLLERDDDPSQTVGNNLYRLQLDQSGTLTSHRIVEFPDSLDPDLLTLATDLPVEELPAPDWVPDRTPLYVGLGTGGAVLLLAGLWWGWRRYRAAR
jgi:hypothetical protein